MPAFPHILSSVRKGTPKAKILAVLWWEIGKNKDEW